MGNVIQLRPGTGNEQLVRALRVLLHKVKNGEIHGLAFVALKRTGPCAGVVNITDEDEAINTAWRLLDVLRGDEEIYEPLEKP